MNWRASWKRALPYLIAATGGFLIAYLVVAFAIFPAEIIPDDAVVPNVVGDAYDDAARKLSSAGFVAQRGETRISARAAARQVLEQDPPGGSREKRGTPVTLHISSGQRTSTVPSVIGGTRQQALLAIENAGLEMGRLELVHSDRPAGQVIAMSPAAGEKLTLPARVDLTVSRGPATSELPNLIGQTLPQARARLQTMGLLVGAVEIDTTSIEMANTVVAQEPAAGQSVVSGAMVKLVISGRRR
jgi:serine/threonine-protein kinase